MDGGPAVRALVTFSTLSLVLFITKPDYAYDQEGRVRPWRQDWNTPESTDCPWWVVPLGASAIVSLF